MPITLTPITRRNFIRGSLALGGSAWIKSDAMAEQPTFDPNRLALLADTHISANPKQSYPGTKWPGTPVKEEEHEWVNMADCLTQSAREVIALNPRPANLIINGDCALSRGTEAEYKEFLWLIEPIRTAGITIHITIGNHDTREKLWKLLPFLKKEQIGVHADVLELPHANVVLLDSGKRGVVEDKQLGWLAQQLDDRKEKPALVFAHYNPLPTHGIRPIRGMKNGKALLKLIAMRKHAKAFFHGHTHEWQHSVEGSIHIIAQPPVSYYFGKGHAHGWVDMNLNETTADLELRCIDPVHKQHGERIQIILKG
ncbi:metallophosphoesterase [Opitutales bacterium]|nr:metallophosphoesterase [Opitutales bacterium]